MTDVVCVELLSSITNAAIMMPAEPGSERARRIAQYFEEHSDLDATIVPPMFTDN